MKTKEEKAQIIKEIKELFSKTSTIIFVSLLKLKGEEQKEFKDKIKEKGGIFKVYKKNLIKKAFPDFILDLEDERFKQPFGVVLNKNLEENIEIFKTVLEFKEKLNFNIIKGIFKNRVLEEKEVLEIGKLPPIEILRAKLLSLLKLPVQKYIFSLKTPIIKMQMVVSNIKK